MSNATAFPIFGAAGYFKVSSGSGTPSDPYVPQVSGAGGSQTPWTGNIDGAGFSLSNSKVVTGTAATITHASVAPALTVNALNPIDTSGGTVTVTYPNPATWSGLTLLFTDVASTFDASNLTITHYSGTLLGGLSADLVCNRRGGNTIWGLYSDGTNVEILGSPTMPTFRLVTDADANLVLSDFGPPGQGGLIKMSSASAHNVIIPANVTIDVPISYECYAMQYGAGAVTATITTDTLRAANGKVACNGQYALIGMRKIAATEWVLFGDRA
jgi:hypothetical protein